MSYGFNDDKSKASLAGEKTLFKFRDYDYISQFILALCKYVNNHNYRIASYAGNEITYTADLTYSKPNAYTYIVLHIVDDINSYERKEKVIRLRVYGTIDEATVSSSVESADAWERHTQWENGTTDQNVTGYYTSLSKSELDNFTIEVTRY